MEKKEHTYEQAMTRLEEIAAKLESGQTGLDELSTLLKEAQELIAACKARLLKAETDINDILAEDGTR
ncbi:MAG: exodeoxyribonuclease VII small subunit [Alloprevotella sp.]|nr:exodeoxyribonuclease VII small subunit [Alloprevotella sp.]MBR1652881.1 exodeoxyribonuclease VII small subunit [Alloprevotella sp.]MBR1732197.1 exodeoxyribonuclease VII small subunit [Alloprevotella sp.]